MTTAGEGIGTRLSYVAARAASMLPLMHYHRYRLVSVARENMPQMPRGFEVRPVGANDLSGRIDANENVVAARLGAGLTPLAAFRGDRIVGATWLIAGAFEEDEAPVRWIPPSVHAWDTGLWIAPDMRMSRAFQALWAGTGNWLDEHDLEGSASRIADYSVASLAPHFRMGARDLGSITIAGAGPMAVSTRGDRHLLAGGRTTVRLGDPR